MEDVIAAEANGVNRDVSVAKDRQRPDVDPTGVVGPVAEKHDGADRQVRGFIRELLEAVADVCGGRCGLQLLQIGDARQVTVETIETCLKLLLDTGERAGLKRLDRLSLPGG